MSVQHLRPPTPVPNISCSCKGAACEILTYRINLGHFSNSVALWIGMQPSEIFFYTMLPPLLLDSAVRIDYFVFKKVFDDYMLGPGDTCP